jgi:hypothetical protein
VELITGPTVWTLAPAARSIGLTIAAMRERDGPRLPLAELLLLDRLPALARVGAIAAALGVAVGWGFAALALHERELALRTDGASLNPVGTLFADGSSPRTLWPGWAAAAVFALSALRQSRAPLEQPAGRRDRAAGVTGLRAGLRREYLAARWALVGVTLLALADCGRLAVSGTARILGVAGAGGDLLWMGVEVAGLLAAWCSLSTWVAAFRIQLGRLGALPVREP